MPTLLVLLLLLVTPAWGAPLVRVATYPDYEPFVFYAPYVDQTQHRELIEPGGRSSLFTGLAWQVVLQSFQRAGYRVELNIVPWPRAVKLLDEGAVDAVFPAIKTPARTQLYLFSEQRVYPQNPLLLYCRSDDKRPYEGLASLNRRRVGMIRGFSYGAAWEEYRATLRDETRPEIVEVNNPRQGFDLLESGRIDVLLGYAYSHDYYLRQTGKEGLFSKSAPFDHARSYLMGNPAAAAIMVDFDRGRQRLEQDGGYQRLRQAWGFE